MNLEGGGSKNFQFDPPPLLHPSTPILQLGTKEYVLKNIMSTLGDLISKLLMSGTHNFDEQVQCGKQVNQISVTNKSIISKQLC